MTTSFHAFLLKHRPFCEMCSGAIRSTHIIKDHKGYDTAVCPDHAGLPQESGSVGEAEWDYRPKQLFRHLGTGTSDSSGKGQPW